MGKGSDDRGCWLDTPADDQGYGGSLNLMPGRSIKKCSKAAATWKTAAIYAATALLGCCWFAIAVVMTMRGGTGRGRTCWGGLGSAAVGVPSRRAEVRIGPAVTSDSLDLQRRQGSKDEEAVAAHGGRDMARVLVEQTSPSDFLKVYGTELLKTKRLVLHHTPQLPVLADLSPSDERYCNWLFRDLVFPPSPDNLSSMVSFYYVLDERCYASGNGTEDEWLMSIRKANVNITSSEAQGAEAPADLDVITYWWPLREPKGPRKTFPTVWQRYNSSSVPMASFIGMELSRLGTNLVFATHRTSGTMKAQVTFLSTAYGNRSSAAIDSDWADGFAFNPQKTKLYLSDPKDQPRLLSFPLGQEEVPLTDFPVYKTEQIFSGGVNGGGPNVSSVRFGRQSLTADGKCLYFVDYLSNRLWAANLSLPQLNFTLVAGTGEAGRDDGLPFQASFKGLRSVVATPDGCNLFTTEVNAPGVVRWLQLDAPCGKARTVVTVAELVNWGLWSLALHDDGTKLTLYVGSNRGHLFQLEIDRSKLHLCEPTYPTPSPELSSAPLSSAPTSSPESLSGPLSSAPPPIPSNDGVPPSLSSAPAPLSSAPPPIPSSAGVPPSLSSVPAPIPASNPATPTSSSPPSVEGQRTPPLSSSPLPEPIWPIDSESGPTPSSGSGPSSTTSPPALSTDGGNHTSPTQIDGLHNASIANASRDTAPPNDGKIVRLAVVIAVMSTLLGLIFLCALAYCIWVFWCFGFETSSS